jgi:hypothetical protein
MKVACMSVIMPVIPMLMRMGGIRRRVSVVMIVVVHRSHFTELESAVHTRSCPYWAV